MAILTYINGIPLYSSEQEALSFSRENGITGFHTHQYQGVTGFMGGVDHNNAATGGNKANYVPAVLEEKINSFTFETKDISHLGESRVFTIKGTQNAIFSLEIYDDSDFQNYYNFDTKTWSTTPYRLSNIELKRNYKFLVDFPTIVFSDATCDYNNDPTIAHDDDNGKIKAGMTVTGLGIPDGSFVKSVTSDTSFELGDALGGSDVSTTGGVVTNGTLTFGGLLKKYTINLYAETVGNVKTSHARFVKFENPDGTVNLNQSIGSDSNILMRTLYQDTVKNLNLSCVAPSLTDASTNIVKGSTSNTNRVVVDFDVTDLNRVRVGDKVTETGIAASVHALVTKVDPDGDNVLEFEMSVSDSVTNNQTITFTPPFNGMTPHDNNSDTGVNSATISSGNDTVITFSITIISDTGRNFNVLKVPTTDDLCAYTTVTFGSSALAIEDENTSSASVFYRWPVTNIANLEQGMMLDPARFGTGVNTTTPALISNYNTTSSQQVLKEGEYDNYITSNTVDSVSVPAVDPYGNDVTAVDRNGRITAQAGNIVFNAQQADALKSDAGVRIFAHGQKSIEALTGVKVELSVNSMAHSGSTNPVRAAASTTTSGAVSSSTTIGLADVGSVSQGMTVSGVGINAAAANPTVVSKSTNDGAGNIVVSSAQTLESGQTLFFNGGASRITIRGALKVSNMAINDVNIFFDVERFLTAV